MRAQIRDERKIETILGRVTFRLGPRALSFYDTVRRDWVAEPGDFDLLIGSSSRDVRRRATVRLFE